MEKYESQKRVLEEEDYIRAPKFSNSLIKFVTRHSEGVENATIARLLMISEEEVEEIYKEAVEKIRKDMVDTDE